MRWRLATLAAVLVLAGCGTDPTTRPAAGPPAATAAALTRAVEIGDLVARLRDLEAIARSSGGDRAAGTPGGERTLDYVAGRLRRAGYAVTEQPVSFPFFEERSPPEVTLGDGDGDALRGIGTLAYSPGGDVRGALAPVAGVGCAPADHAEIDAGEIAGVTRGTCRLRAKAALAADAGAAAVLIVNTERRAARAGRIPQPGHGRLPESGAPRLRRRARAGEPVRRPRGAAAGPLLPQGVRHRGQCQPPRALRDGRRRRARHRRARPSLGPPGILVRQ